MAQQKFLFNDYASREGDPGVEHQWDLGEMGKVPIRIRKALSIRDRRKASEAATKMIFKPDGMPEIKGFDDGLYSLMIAEAVIVEWPFEESDGTPTPINRKNLEALPSFAIDALSNKYANIKKEQDAAADPFGSKSDGASSQTEPTQES